MTATNIDSPIDIVVIPDNLQICINDNVERIDPLIMRLLVHFYDNQHKVVTRQLLSEQVWHSPHTSDEAINRGISRLRKLLGSKRDAFIKTIPKQGYQFILPENVNLVVGDKELSQKESQRKSQRKSQKELQTKQQSEKIENIKINSVAVETIKTQVEPELIKALPAAEQLPSSNDASKTKINPLIIAAIFISLVLTFVLWPTQPPDNSTKQTQSHKIPLAVAPFTMSVNTSQISDAYIQVLHSQLKTELEQTHKFEFGQTDNPYMLSVNIEENSPINITININHRQQNINHFAQLQFPKTLFNNDSKMVINEIAAFTRLMLVYNQHDRRLLKAYKPLTYFEIEQLAQVTKGGWYIYDRLPHHYQLVTKLQQKYPEVAEIPGILARLDAMRVTNLNVDVVKEKHHQLENALKALSLDPGNFDGLYAAFLHNMDFPEYRAKSIDYANSMKSYYPHHPRAWRNQLLLMIENRLPCNSINEFVSSIPNGIFKPYRLNTIAQILTTCIEQQSPQSLYQQLKFLPNNKVDRAIINNFNLFDVRHDNLWQQDNRNTIVFNTLSFYQRYFVHQLMRGDSSGALNFLQKIDHSQNQYWRWLSQLYLSLYQFDSLSNAQVVALAQDAQHQEHNLWRNDYVSILQQDAELYFAAAMIKHSHSGFNQQRLQHYLNQRPSFPINVINRKESLAKIMLLLLAGQAEQAASIANQLYKQLEQNYQTSPSSFKFWNLGRYHLLAKLYCGQSCGADKIEPQQYLNKVFSEHHIWWLDEYQFMKQALKPWQDSAITKAYLQKVENDLNRIKK